MKLVGLLILFLSLNAFGEANLESHDFSFEYGLAYHTLKEEQKSNQSKGRLTSDQNPYWLGAYTVRISQRNALRFFGGISLVRFNEPAFGKVIGKGQDLNQFGLEFLSKTGPVSKFGFFLMQQDHPYYYAVTPTDYQIGIIKFAQAGLHLQLGQRRRIGLLWGLGLKAFTIFPTKGGPLATEAGAGGEGYLRFGWVGPLGALYQIKGFYQGVTAPNAEVSFSHEILGYCLQISHSF